MNWTRPFDEIAVVCRERVAVRDAGFGDPALAHPRDDLALTLLCAFNGTTPDKAPAGWRYFPNETTKKAWQRVADAAREALGG